jgi:hypothetical protein
MAIWTRIKLGGRENPGCWDNGDGSITTVYESAEVPGVTLHVRRVYAVGRGSDETWYVIDGVRVSEATAAARCVYGVPLAWEDAYATGRERVIPALSLTPDQLVRGWDVRGRGQWTEYAADCRALANRVAKVERWRVAAVYTGSVQTGEDYARETHGYGRAVEGDPVRSLSTVTVLLDADGEVICRWPVSISDPPATCAGRPKRNPSRVRRRLSGWPIGTPGSKSYGRCTSGP